MMLIGRRYIKHRRQQKLIRRIRISSAALLYDCLVLMFNNLPRTYEIPTERKPTWFCLRASPLFDPRLRGARVAAAAATAPLSVTFRHTWWVQLATACIAPGLSGGVARAQLSWCASASLLHVRSLKFQGQKLRKQEQLGRSSLQVFTVRLHVMQRTVLLSEFCPSVCPSVRQMRVLWEN